MVKVKTTNKNKNNLNMFELLLIFFVLALVAYIGYLVHNRQPLYLSSGGNRQSPVAQDVSSAPTIQTAKDLDKAARVLDKNDPAASSNDAKQLDSQSSGL
jgi:ABC-type microcin C transport system permease subunit YejE